MAKPWRLCACAVMVRAMLAGFFGVMLGVSAVAVRYMSVVAGHFVVAGGMMRGCFAMVLRGMFVMLGCFQMVFLAFFRHGSSF